jgi:CheY-like chemotaxis protein
VQIESTRRCHILLVEDHPVNQRLALEMLKKLGHEVTAAANGLQALAALDRRGFDLVLMDVQMPEMDGIAATRAIRTQEWGTGRHLPIVAMTAHALKGDRARFLEAGMDAYLSKPVRLPELVRAIESAVLASKPPAYTPPS